MHCSTLPLLRQGRVSQIHSASREQNGHDERIPSARDYTVVGICHYQVQMPTMSQSQRSRLDREPGIISSPWDCVVSHKILRTPNCRRTLLAIGLYSIILKSSISA